MKRMPASARTLGTCLVSWVLESTSAVPHAGSVGLNRERPSVHDLGQLSRAGQPSHLRWRDLFVPLRAACGRPIGSSRLVIRGSSFNSLLEYIDAL